MVDESQDDASESFEDEDAADSQPGGDEFDDDGEFPADDQVADEEFADDEFAAEGQEFAAEGGEVPDGEDTLTDGGEVPDGEDTLTDGDEVPDGEDTLTDGDEVPDGEDTLTDGGEVADEEFTDDEFSAEGDEFVGEADDVVGDRERKETPAAGHDLPAEQFEDGEIPDDAPSDAWESEHADEAFDADSSQTSPAGYEEADVSPEDIADEDIPEDLYDEEPDDAGDETLDADDESLDAEDSEPDEIILEDELESILNPAEPESVDAEPLPEVGPYLDPATLTLWIAGEEHETFAIAQDQLVIGAGPDEADEEAAPTVDVDLGPYLDGDDVWQRHAEVFRHNKNYTLCVTSDGSTQVNDNLMELGDQRRLEDGDIVVLGGEVGLEFHLPETRTVAESDQSPVSGATDEEFTEAEGIEDAESGPVDDETATESGAEVDEMEEGFEEEEPAAELQEEAPADDFADDELSDGEFAADGDDFADDGDEFADDEFADDEFADDDFADEEFDDEF